MCFLSKNVSYRDGFNGTCFAGNGLGADDLSGGSISAVVTFDCNFSRFGRLRWRYWRCNRAALINIRLEFLARDNIARLALQSAMFHLIK